MKTKQFELTDFKAVDGEAPGTFEALVSVFDNIDLADEVIIPGAFDRCLAERNQFPVVWSHQWTLPPVGLSEVRSTDKGLVARGQLFVNGEDSVEIAKHIWTAMKAGALREWSVGLNVKRERYENRNGKQVVVLEDLDLIELGPCLKGVNQATETISVKALEDEIARTKGVLPVTQLSFAPREAGFDGTIARQHVKDYASDADGNVDLAKYDRAFLWVDGDAGDNLTGRRYIVADIVDGTLKYVPRAIFAAANVLMGGRGVDASSTIGDAGVAELKKSVERLYARMRTEFDDTNIIVPWSEKAISSSTQENPQDPTRKKQDDMSIDQKRAILSVLLT